MSDVTNDTPIHPKVKEINKEGVRTFQVKLEGHLLWALEEYAKENNISNSVAFRDLLEARLFRLGKLPSWWYERGALLRGNRTKKK